VGASGLLIHTQRQVVRQPDRTTSVADFVEAMDSRQGERLRTILVAGDLVGLTASIVATLTISSFMRSEGVRATVIGSLVFALVGLWSMRSQELWLARVSAIRVLEVTKITRALVIFALSMVVFDRVVHFGLYLRHVIATTLIAWLLIVTWRSIYRTWLAAARAHDRYCRRVVIVGADEETARLIDLFTTHPEVGVRVAGVIGERERAESYGCGSMWLGRTECAESVIEMARVRGVILSSVAVTGRRLNEMIRNLQDHGVHVHVATGIAGIDARRMRSLPIGHEPLLYIEPRALGRLQRIGKRVFDIVAAGLTIVLVSPLLALVALLIKLDDGGPIMFRQTRVGLRGETFGVLKFRTMKVGAERMMAALSAGNERLGPLFKMHNDPRVTRVGRFLRTSSLDELPQLFNVMRGEMSLVGPRPALPIEVAQFPADLRSREDVLPGITGLWQVEARDNPSFEAYRRLDLFYVENWSIVLDLLIILGTVEQLAARMLRMATQRGVTENTPSDSPTIDLELVPDRHAS
jgi:exopolysaccharide biosynthesis polyprenyl glycosylphosphotransferase